MPKWNSGLPMRNSRLSYSCEDRVVQPNLSYRYRQRWPTAKTVRQTYGRTTHRSSLMRRRPG